MHGAPAAAALQSVMAQESCSDAWGEVLKSTVLLFILFISQWKPSSSVTLEFTSHHIADSSGAVQPPFLSVSGKNVFGENKAFIFPFF